MVVGGGVWKRGRKRGRDGRRVVLEGGGRLVLEGGGREVVVVVPPLASVSHGGRNYTKIERGCGGVAEKGCCWEEGVRGNAVSHFFVPII